MEDINSYSQLRQLAAQYFSTNKKNNNDLNSASILDILKNLNKHQLDLEMQNEELKKSHIDLIYSKSKYYALYSTSPVGYFTLDSNGYILEANRAGAKMLNEARISIKGQLFTAFVDFEFHKEFQKLLQDTLKKNTGQYRDVRFILKKKPSFKGRIYSVATTFLNEGDKKIYVTVIDLTEKNKPEKEITITKNELQRSEKMQAIGQLAGGIALDFNNKLCCIMGYAELIKDNHHIDFRTSNYIDQIICNAKKSSKLSLQLLAFIKKGKYLSIVIDIHRIISDILSLLDCRTKSNIHIEKRLKAKPPTIIGDPRQIQNALLKIVANACNAMPDGGTLTFSTDMVILEEEYRKKIPYTIKKGNYLQICIKDTGNGMNEETRKKIFKPFFTTKDRDQGTGTGLAAVYGTIKNHGGYIDLFSETGHGTTFKIYLPSAYMDQEDVSSTLPNHSKLGSAKTKKRQNGIAHILLVDDEVPVCKVVKKMLISIGYTVTAFNSGKEAVSYYKNEWKNIDLVIIDMIMPEMDGRVTFLELRKINPGVKAIISSGYDVEEKTQMIFKEGVMGYIQKPYLKNELSRITADVLYI